MNIFILTDVHMRRTWRDVAELKEQRVVYAKDNKR